MKLVMILDSLSAGGIQASTLKIVERCAGDKTLLLLHGKIELPVPEGVSVSVLEDVSLNGSSAFRWLRRLSALSKEINKANPDIVMSMGFSVNVMLLLTQLFAGRKARIVVGVRNSLKELALTRSRWNLLRLLTPWLYNHADLVVTVSQGIAREFTRAGLPERCVKVIYNGYEFAKIQRLAAEKVDHEWFTEKRIPVIVAAGRLSVQKNFPLLLEAFRLVLDKSECRLAIIGKGPEEISLKERAVSLGIGRSVAFLGNQENPFRFFAKADLFALSSRWEGFPNVVCEAMACGLPVVSTDCPTGPNEIIRDGENGLLVPTDNPAALAEAILELLQNEDRRRIMAGKAYESVQKFSIDRMIAEYDACFARLTEAN